MNQINPTIRPMTFEEQQSAGLFDKSLMLEQGKWTYRLSAGTADSLYVYESGTLIYVLTVNRHQDYVALDCYIGSEVDPVDSIFLQGNDTLTECLDKDWDCLPLAELARRMVLFFG